MAEEAETEGVSELCPQSVFWYEYTGGSGTVDVNAADGVAWSAVFQSSAGSWLTFTGPSSGTGKGTLKFVVVPLADAPRAGTIQVTAGTDAATINVLQLAAPIWYENIVLSTPLPVIEQMALLGAIKEINKAPPPARPVLIAALTGLIVGLGPTVEAVYLAYPTVPQIYTPLFISHEVQVGVTYVLEHLSGQ
jgi:hypothetical protein